MPHKRTNVRQSIHLHGHDIRRHIALHIHMDSTHRVHRHIHNRYDIRHMFTQGQLLDQQYRKKC